MSDDVDKPKKGGGFGRFLAFILILGLVGTGLYGASWLNARKYFLIVDATEVHVHRGKMLPVGHQPFVPFDANLRAAYETFPLPGGMTMPRGETVFDDRVQLDQALYRMLRDATVFSLEADNARTSELSARYLKQIKALPGINLTQQVELKQLERDAAYAEARGHLEKGTKTLERARALFDEATKGSVPRPEAGQWKLRLDKALHALTDPAPKPVAVEPPPIVKVATTTTSTKP